MALNHYFYIFKGTDMDPTHDRTEIKNSNFHFVAVGVSQIEQAVAVAEQALTEGAQAIELCGAFGIQGKKLISDAIGNKIPVGNVSY